MRKLTCMLWMIVALCHAEAEDAVADKEIAPLPGAAAWTQDYETACRQAKEADRPMVLYFTGPGSCHDCAWLDAHVFSKPEWDAYIRPKFIMAVIDPPQSDPKQSDALPTRNAELARRYNIKRPPTFVMLEPDGETVIGVFGISAPVSLYNVIALFGTVERFAQGRIQNFTAKLDPAVAKDYTGLLDALRDANETVTTWLDTDPDPTPENIERMTLENGRIEVLSVQVEKIEKAQLSQELAGNEGVSLLNRRLLGRTRGFIELVKDLETAERDLSQWVQGHPVATAENRAIYSRLLKRIKDAWREIASSQRESS